jgi:hypothetical protein
MTWRNPLVRSATTATEWASTGSVLRTRPVANTRARADSLDRFREALTGGFCWVYLTNGGSGVVG